MLKIWGNPATPATPLCGGNDKARQSLALSPSSSRRTRGALQRELERLRSSDHLDLSFPA